MSDKNFKTIRKQLVNVAKSMMDEIFSTEAIKKMHEKLSEQVEKRLEGLTAHMKFTLDKIDERSKEIQAYTLRNSTTPVAAPTEQAVPPTDTTPAA